MLFIKIIIHFHLVGAVSKLLSVILSYLMLDCGYLSCVVARFQNKNYEDCIVTFPQPEVQQWLKIVSTNDNNPLHNYICLSAVAYRRKPRHEGLPILTSVIQKLVKLGMKFNICQKFCLKCC